MTMHMGIRIKATDDPLDLALLQNCGGWVVDGKYPKFAFSSDIARNRFEDMRKRIKGGESLESVGKAHSPTITKIT